MVLIKETNSKFWEVVLAISRIELDFTIENWNSKISIGMIGLISTQILVHCEKVNWNKNYSCLTKCI